MGIINAVRSHELCCRYTVYFIPPACVDIFSYHFIYTDIDWLYGTGSPVQDTIKYLCRHLVIIFRHQNLVTTLLQVCLCITCHRSQGINCFSFHIPMVSSQRLIFKHNKKAPCNGLFGTNTAYQVFIILLQHQTSLVSFVFHFFPDRIQVTVNICPFCQHFELKFYRADF